MDCIIRKMNKNDVKEVFDMMKTFYATEAVINKPNDSALQTNIEYCLKDDDLLTCYVIVTDGKIAGYSILSKCYSTEYGGICMWVEDIYIKPEYRKFGLGNKLMKFIDEEYKWKAVRYKLEVEENNILAMKLYEKSGFQKSKYIVMVKEAGVMNIMNKKIKIKKMPEMDGNPFCFDGDDGKRPKYILTENIHNGKIEGILFLCPDNTYFLYVRKIPNEIGKPPQYREKCFNDAKCISADFVLEEYIKLTEGWES